MSGRDTAVADNRVLHVFLMQNSGWMEPFYADSGSKFKPLVKTVVKRVAGGQNVVIASFNQSVDDSHSPLLLYRGNDPDAIGQSIQGIALAKKPGSNAYADTDFKEAVIGAITQYSPRRPCILWIFTNNKNSPQNSSETAVKNGEFYRWLQNEDKIVRIVSYAYPMPVKGVHYSANGIMIYALAYGNPANDELEKLIANKLPFEDRPARLKPLNADAVTFVPTGVAKKGNYSAFLGPDRNTLVLQFDSATKPEIAVISGVFRNDFFPYDIRSADLTLNVQFLGESHGIQSEVEPHRLDTLATGKQTSTIVVKIRIPPLPNMWSNPEIIFRSGYETQAIMEFNLADQKLELSPDFLARMNKLFPGDPLPEIFVPGESSRHSISSRPLIVKVEYPVWPLILLGLLVGAFILGTILLLSALTRTKKFVVVVDGMQKTYSLKAFGKCSLYTDRGEKIGVIERGLGKPNAKLENGRKEQVKILH
jgi:hypothetical protein